MTVIRPNSISGITSITAQANEINVFKSDGTLAGLSLNGVNFNTTTGVSTFNNLNVGGVLTYEDVTNVDSVGVITARSAIDAQGTINLADSIIHTGDTNTKIRFPANDTVTFETAGSERLRITSAGTLQVQGDGNAYLTLGRYTNDDKGSRVRLIKSRNTTFGSNTIVQDGDTLGTIDFYGSDSNSGTRGAASISAEVDGTPGSADMPGRLVFRTAPDNSTVLTERLRITSAGNLKMPDAAEIQLGNDTQTATGDLRLFHNGSNSGIINSQGALYITNDATNSSDVHIRGKSSIQLHCPADGNVRFQINNSGAFGLNGANYGTAGQVLTSQGSGSAPQWASPSGIQQTVYQIKGGFETEATNSNTSGTPESIIDGCQAQIQVTNANSKIMVTYAGFNFYSKRYGPALAYIDIGFADSSSSGVNFSVGDYSTLGTDGSGSHRKPKSPTSSDWYRGEAGPGCVRVLHTHGKAVGKYLYYTLMCRQTYSSSNSPGYIFNGGSGYFTVTLQEIL